MTEATVELPFHDRDLGQARKQLARYLKEVKTSVREPHRVKLPSYYRAGRDLLDLDYDEQVAVLLAAFTQWASTGFIYHTVETMALTGLLGHLTRRKLPFTAGDIAAFAAGLERLGRVRNDFDAHGLIGPLEVYASASPLPDPALGSLRVLRDLMANQYQGKEGLRTVARLDELLGDPTEIRIRIAPGEAWSDAALAELKGLPEDRRDAWARLLSHCGTATASKPAPRWLVAAGTLLTEVSVDSFRAHIGRWFPLANRWAEVVPPDEDLGDLPARVQNEATLKGLAWCAGLLDHREAARALGTLALAAYKSGPLAPSLGNAAILSLGAMPGREGLAQLAVLKVRLTRASARKRVEKALEATAKRLGLAADEIDELGVPDYGMAVAGRLCVPMGEFAAELTLQGDGSTEVVWVRPGGKPQKSVPAGVKKEHPAALKELKATARDIEKMVTAQRGRMDLLFRARKSWRLDVWRERYLDHPLVGILARRLIWRFTTTEGELDGIYSCHDDRIVGRDDRPLDGLEPETTVELWHPIDRDVRDVLAWRTWLEEHGIQQPFKQAHREVYVLTDAEGQTRVYSNRFAAHILRQHQFHALCGVRGWKDTLRLMVGSDHPPPSLSLPEWGLCAEFLVEGAGDRFGQDTNATGTYLYLSTDQVRFTTIDAIQPTARVSGGGFRSRPHSRLGRVASRRLALEEVPPLVFSEVMRDVDLFVGVASVGNDPTWSDGGPNGRHAGYWQHYAFGELSATAETRKAVLQRLIPRLKIAGRCSFSDRFLVVRGELRAYKIHLGSGNILMEPNDQYLCIVPDPGGAGAGAGSGSGAARGGQVFLPFEGDATLSIILSKALLLADDRKITDPTIVRQIQPDR
jgi:hypothetical protein